MTSDPRPGETVPCRGCRTPLDPASVMCPICLRPRGGREIASGLQALGESERLRRRRPFVILLSLLLAGAACWAIGSNRMPLAAAVASLHARAARFFQEAENPRNLVSGPSVSDVPPPAAAPQPPPRVPAPAMAAALPAPPPAAAPAPPAEPKPQPAPPPARVEDLPVPSLDPDTQWALYGRVYDLISLLPVANVQLTFRAEGTTDNTVATDDYGRYSAVLGRSTEGNYEIFALRQGFASQVLYESDIPYAALPVEKRRALARAAQDGDSGSPTLTDAPGENSLRRDLFLVPSR